MPRPSSEVIRSRAEDLTTHMLGLIDEVLKENRLLQIRVQALRKQVDEAFAIAEALRHDNLRLEHDLLLEQDLLIEPGFSAEGIDESP